MEALLAGIQAIFDFFNDGIYTLITEAFGYMATWAVVFWIKIKISSLVFFWGVAELLLQSLGISSLIQSAWGSLDNDFVNFISRYKLPDALNMILNAYVTRYIMGLISL